MFFFLGEQLTENEPSRVHPYDLTVDRVEHLRNLWRHRPLS